MFALTFDDGPGKYTERILDTLQANGAKATFFMLGKNVSNYPDAVKKMDSMGCELANHTYDHVSLDSLDASGVLDEVGSSGLWIHWTGKPETRRALTTRSWLPRTEM